MAHLLVGFETFPRFSYGTYQRKELTDIF